MECQISMIKSMTGFGRYEYSNNQRKITVEMKAVNHRYLEMNIKMPRKFNIFESKIRTEIKKYAERGKMDMFITYEDLSEHIEEVCYNADIAAQYIEKFKEIEERFSIPNDVRVTTLLRCPDVFTMEEKKMDEEELWEIISHAVEGASEKFVETRIAEGENLKTDLLEKLNVMMSLVEYIEDKSPQIIADYRKKLEDKVKEMLSDSQIDDSRIAAETVIFADKICIDEEIVRLRSHISSMSEALLSGGAVGRKLDFIAQEMNREANTILSKTVDIEISNRAIDLKTEIEKIREQVQNIE